MSYSPDQLTKIAESYAEVAEKALIVEGKKKAKKIDPKAKCRNRGKVIFPAERSKDHTDHYPINNIDQAKSALRYAGKQKSAPWYNGTVEGMQKAVRSAVYKAFPALKPDAKSKKSSLNEFEEMFAKYAEGEYEQEVEQAMKQPGIQMPTDRITAYPPTSTQYPPVDKSIQVMLHVDPDGKLGPQTQSALDRYKASIGSPRLSNEEAFDRLIKDPRYGRKPLPWDPKTQTYATLPTAAAPAVSNALVGKLNALRDEIAAAYKSGAVQKDPAGYAGRINNLIGNKDMYDQMLALKNNSATQVWRWLTNIADYLQKLSKPTA